MSELEALRHLAALLPAPPEGEVWFGDDAAVVTCPPSAGTGAGPDALLLLAADTLVGGVDADFSLTSLADFGWKALAVNLSDIAAMGGAPGHALVSVTGARPDELDDIYEGLLEAAREYSCPVVGGDLSAGPNLVVSVAVTGWVQASPLLRSGAKPGDGIWVSGPLGAAAGGLRLLRSSDKPRNPAEQRLAQAHARPRPALREGIAAREAGATAMTDVSDGLATDLGHLADSSGVGFELDNVPVAPGATLDEAIGGGDDYVLVFSAPSDAPVAEAFTGLPAPIRIGTCVGDPARRSFRGAPLPPKGWEHRL
ncbi:MAG: thiamine-phosphate kinase [Acidimicrobiales bacterium]